MMKQIRIHPLSLLAGLAVFGLLSMAQQGKVAKIVGLTPEQREILGHMSIVYLDDGFGNTLKTIRFSKVNVQIVNGLGATNGNPTLPNSQNEGEVVTNGLGNVIVGYNELGSDVGDDRTGSHNVVVGQKHHYASFGGLVVGLNNAIQDVYASVSGGVQNVASGNGSSVAGGEGNEACGHRAAVTGGSSGIASGSHASVAGGLENEATGPACSVLGGWMNTASSNQASVGGGYCNSANGNYAAVCGGNGNTSNGVASTVCGGRSNTASGGNSVVSGGFDHSVTGNDDWMAGSLFEDN